MASCVASFLLFGALIMVGIGGSGCAATKVGGAASTEANLAAAEFQAVPAVTPAQKQYLATLPPYKIHMVTQGSRVAYVYADPLKNMLYVGGQKEYAAYQTFSITQGMDRQEMQTAEANVMSNLGGNTLTPWEYVNLGSGGESFD